MKKEMKSSMMVSSQPETMELLDLGIPTPKKPVSICGVFPNLAMLTHDGTLYELRIKHRFFQPNQIEWIKIPTPPLDDPS